MSCLVCAKNGGNDSNSQCEERACSNEDGDLFEILYGLPETECMDSEGTFPDALHGLDIRYTHRKRWYCFLDVYSGYNQMSISLEDQEKTTFTCPYRAFALKRMPFGLCNALATFQRCMVSIFSDMVEDTIEVFMDDFLVIRGSFDWCLSYLVEFLKRCEDCNLVINWENVTLW